MLLAEHGLDEEGVSGSVFRSSVHFRDGRGISSTKETIPCSYLRCVMCWTGLSLSSKADTLRSMFSSRR